MALQGSIALKLLVFLLGVTLPRLFFSTAEAGKIGVSYGRVADNLPDPASVVKLLQRSGITMVRLYDTDTEVLRAFANTGIKVMVMMPNDEVAAAAGDRSYALRWARDNVAVYYPATLIDGVAVGNEVFAKRPDLTWQLVPAMINVQAALAELGLADVIKVSTPIAFTALKDTYPPSSARFRDDIAESVMKPMLEFLHRTGSYVSINPYPFFAYAEDPENIPLDYALGNYEPGVPDRNTGLVYHSLLDAMMDATYFAIENLTEHLNVKQPGGQNGGLGTTMTETGSPTRGEIRRGGSRFEASDGFQPATVANAKAYNNYVINRVLSGKTGTPHRPNGDMDIYIFALFNENQKGQGPDDVEQYFGLFYPNMTKVYEFDFRGGKSWCVADPAVGDERLQAGLDWACGQGGADCSAIQPGGTCFYPDTKVAHASYAFNDYYQRQGRPAGACDFNGSAFVVFQEPAEFCDPNASWCVANAEVGDDRLEKALDFACVHGADCGAIQPGGKCFEPNTRVAHASHAFNSYYQRNHRAKGTCDFAGAAHVVYSRPKFGSCVVPSSPLIKETEAKSEGYAAI